jgi:hypothetical protein
VVEAGERSALSSRTFSFFFLMYVVHGRKYLILKIARSRYFDGFTSFQNPDCEKVIFGMPCASLSVCRSGWM